MEIQEVLEQLRKNTSDNPPKVIRKSENHVVVKDPNGGERLDEDFESSGTRSL
jgi:hypothetical protein